MTRSAYCWGTYARNLLPQILLNSEAPASTTHRNWSAGVKIGPRESAKEACSSAAAVPGHIIVVSRGIANGSLPPTPQIAEERPPASETATYHNGLLETIPPVKAKHSLPGTWPAASGTGTMPRDGSWKKKRLPRLQRHFLRYSDLLVA